ncbi:MAG: zinc-ribbon domain-containing protein [Alphaproteobacteria bacterium]|nr:zinc-ribbon domain-containing protein [Alphaproteobacteria bacterium]
MILSCPVCRTRYLVDEGSLHGQSGRTVRCSNCGHTWHRRVPPELAANEEVGNSKGRIEPALELPPRPAAALEGQPRPRPVPDSLGRSAYRNRWGAVRWLVLAALLTLAVLAGVVVARGAIVALWPPAARLYSLAGLSAEPAVTGLKIENLVPLRTPEGLTIEGDIANNGRMTQDLPRLRVALRDSAEKEVQFKIVDPPQPRLAPGAVVHFKTPFDHPEEAAKGVVVTFAKQ